MGESKDAQLDEVRLKIDTTTARLDAIEQSLIEAAKLRTEWELKHNEKHRWFNFMMAALSSGASPKRAQRRADDACAMFNERFDERCEYDEG